jgi:hypothetical protein
MLFLMGYECCVEYGGRVSAGGGNQGRTSVGRDCFKCLPALANSLHMMMGTKSDILVLFFIAVGSRILSKQSVVCPFQYFTI